MIAVDTNILVYAHREDSPWHEAAYESVRSLADGRAAWAIPWPCIHEFLSIVTHPRIYRPSTPVPAALDQVSAWIESPSLVLLGEAAGYWDVRSSRRDGWQVRSCTTPGWQRCARSTAFASCGARTAISRGWKQSRSGIRCSDMI